jgi:hypothetical protein
MKTKFYNVLLNLKEFSEGSGAELPLKKLRRFALSSQKGV